MNEHDARDVVLVWAIENADQQREVLTDSDRMYASRSASELAQWAAADGKGAASPELFLQKRAEQILKKVGERTPAFARFAARRDWLRVAGIVLPGLALLAGVLADRIADPHRVDLLSAPLLLIILWNLLAYAGLLVRRLRAASGTRPDTVLSARLAKRRLPLPRRIPQALAAALAAALAMFGTEWSRLSAPLYAARFRRIVHLSAAMLAVGAIISLYARGLISEYRAGWESTFLDAEGVHAILSVVFMPAMALLGLGGFSVDEVRALHFSRPAAPGSGASWVHLYAATLLLAVVLPRVLLALPAFWKERSLTRRFPLDLDQPYFRRLVGQSGPAAPAVLRVIPYSFTVDEVRDRNLAAVASMLLGDQARVMLRPSVSYGETPQDMAAGAAADIALTVLLFNLNATPEKENHGAFLERCARGDARVMALIDESAYLERVGMQAGGNDRLQERIGLWMQFCALHHVPAAIVNLMNPDARADDLERGFASLARAR